MASLIEVGIKYGFIAIGVGSCHYFITYSLFVLYAVPEVTSLAFATITHAITLLLVIIIAPTCLAIDKFLVLKRGSKV